MMRGIYIHNGSKTQFSGVDKKIKNQITAFSKHFDMTEIIVEKKTSTPIESIMWRLPGGSWGVDYENALQDISQLISDSGDDTFFYIRNGLVDRKYILFLKRLRERFFNSTFLLEVPTFPYQKEWLQSKTMWPWFYKDAVYRKRLSKYIDRVVTYSKESRIFGVETIRISNGIIVGDLSERHRTIEHGNDREIGIIAVAQFQKSHGYERIIEGLARYYRVPREQRIVLHMVGDGEERRYYQDLCNKYGLNDRVIFYGPKHGDELEEIYQKADLGLGCFGLYKRNIRTISSLKTAEYLSHGLPIVTGCKENILEKLDSQYYCEFPNDNSNIDFEQIVDFYNRLRDKYSSEEIQFNLYEYAKKTIDMSITMKPVIDYIESRKK